MSFKTAIEHFENAAQLAEEKNNPAIEQIALGMIEFAKAARGDLHKVESSISDIKSKINGLR
jgi:hypothetical protein